MKASPFEIIQGLERRGVPRNAAIGLAGNYAVESGFDTGINEIAPLVKGSRGGFGLAQWTGPRRRQFENYARERGVDLADLGTQLDFTVWELNNTEKRARNAIYAAANPEEAAKAVSKKFLRPGIPHLDRRLEETRKIISEGSPDDAPAEAQELAQVVDEETPNPNASLLADIDALLGVEPDQTSPADIYQKTAMPQTFDNEELLTDIDNLLGSNEPTEPAQNEDVTSLVDEVGRQVGLAGRAVAEGGASLVGIATDPVASLQNMIFGTDVKPFREQVSGALTSLGVPEPESASEKVISAINEGIIGAVGGVGLAGTLGKKAATETGKAASRVLSANPTSQAVSGGLAGAGQKVAEVSGAGPVGQTVAAIAGGLAGSPVGIDKTPNTPRYSQAKKVVEAGEKHGVDVLTSDALPPKTFIGRTAQATGEKIPFSGTGQLRAKQADQRRDAVESLVKEYAGDTGQITDDILAGVTSELKVGQQKFLDRQIALKKEVFDNVKDAGPVPVPSVLDKIDDVLAQLDGKKGEGFKKLSSQLKTWRGDLKNNTNINDLDFMRRTLGESFKDQSLANVRKVAEDAISSLYGPLRKDISSFVAENGQRRDVTKLRVANKRLSENMNEIKLTGIKSVLSKSDVTPEAVKRILFSQNVSEVRALYKSLPPKGKTNARAAIIQDVFERSSGVDTISPRRFVSNLEKRSKAVGVFFSGDDKRAVDGLVKVLKATSRADEAAINPATGAQLVPIVGASAVSSAFGFAGGIAAAGGLGGVIRLAESPQMRNILIRLSKAKKNSKAYKNLIQTALSTAREMQDVRDQDEGVK